MQVKAHGRASVARALDILITRLALMMNVKHNITPPQITTIVYDLLELYPNETIEDFALVFKRMRQDYYGPNYHQVSETTIIACMKLHLEEKWAEKERQLKKERDEAEKRDILNRTNSMTTAQILKEYERIAKEGPQPDKPKDKNVSEDYLKFKENYMRDKLIQEDILKRVEEKIEEINNGDQVENKVEEPQGGVTDTADQGDTQP
jgi:hypothetical protein